MPAYDTPPPPPTDLLRTRPKRSGPVFVALGVGFLITLFSLFGFRQARLARESAAPRKKSLVKTAKLAKAALLYAADHEYFPGGYAWEKKLKPYGIGPADLLSPTNTYSRYSMREGSSRRKAQTIPEPETFALFFEGFGGSPHGHSVRLDDAWHLSTYRQGREVGNVFSFADGHSAFISQNDWHPDDLSKGPVR